MARNPLSITEENDAAPDDYAPEELQHMANEPATSGS